jgi:hypothetical protein
MSDLMEISLTFLVPIECIYTPHASLICLITTIIRETSFIRPWSEAGTTIA